MKNTIINSILTAVIIIMAVAFTMPSTVGAQTSNKGLVREYCTKHYATRDIKYTNNKPYKKSKKYVFVEKVKSISDGGKHGHTKDGYYITYNKKVKKGKRVTSYLIYNPKTNYTDDIVAVVDNKKIR